MKKEEEKQHSGRRRSSYSP